MSLQYSFFRTYFYSPNIELYFQERSKKYDSRESIIPLFTSIPIYFEDWLAGFIESEGSFSHRKKGGYSFSISQNNDHYLIKSIRDYYMLQHRIKKGKISGVPLYEFSVGSAIGTQRVVSHCIPRLQGYKYYQLAEFVLASKICKHQVKEFVEE